MMPWEAMCFGTIQRTIYDNAAAKLPSSQDYRIVKDEVTVELPVRVNWGGGWTDTPPHCNECGGVVLNAALKLNGIYPIQIQVKKLKELHVEFASTDIGGPQAAWKPWKKSRTAIILTTPLPCTRRR